MSTTDARMHRFCCCLELMAALTKAAQETGCGWTFDEWWALLRTVSDSQDARCVVLRLIHGLEWTEIGERLDVSRARVQQRYQRAMRMLAQQKQVIRLLCDSYPKARTA